MRTMMINDDYDDDYFTDHILDEIFTIYVRRT